MLALLRQLDKSQWFSAGEIAAMQFRQLAEVCSHARRTVPYYRTMFSGMPLGMGPDKLREIWGEIPVLTRQDVQTHEKELVSNLPPVKHGRIMQKKTSGSTGRPITMLSTELEQLFWKVITVREHLWHKRDFSGKLSAIRRSKWDPGDQRDGSCVAGWGPATDIIFRTGQSSLLNIQNDICRQAEWLCAENPEYLISFPSNLHALADLFIEQGLRLTNVREIRTVGEVVSSRLRDLCRQAWDAPVVDIYSAQEVGYIALQCPENDHYHVQSETMLVEVLDDHDQPTAAGQVGRLVLTPFYNFAMPFIRYEIGDYAEVGEPCSCGRGLPVLRRILGRVRNMVTYPTGEKKWPYLGENKYAEIAPVLQYQLVQTHLDKIEARLVVGRPLTVDEESALARHIQSELGYRFRIDFAYLETINRSANFKFEDFISLLTETTGSE
ncbi:MAG: phenylacetate--CoA ligase family protein [Deltaproteobacteria bacterium]|nr:phenylacetate--CoA ligase family protein [Candidatus Anaeroferrophillus wilburensis]MBN2888408.1 phenylacetate--CoA ligase family protein [Deltaproteobacteria bacterium]